MKIRWMQPVAISAIYSSLKLWQKPQQLQNYVYKTVQHGNTFRYFQIYIQDSMPRQMEIKHTCSKQSIKSNLLNFKGVLWIHRLQLEYVTPLIVS